MSTVLARRLTRCVPAPVRQHPLSVLAMGGWAALGASLITPAINPADPKPWPDLLWPALTVTEGERLGIIILAIGMLASGLAFITSHLAASRWGRAAIIRWQSLWTAAAVGVYIVVGLTLKASQGGAAWWWPVSLIVWLTTISLLALAAIKSAEDAHAGALTVEPPSHGEVTRERQ